ncbi:MAG: hypothetical protein KAJ64_05140, partial [Thermoplasmata archaeon]|nr:hypothetical protein [Thermoplasmata archaeon]
TYLPLVQMGTRQFITPGDQEPQPGTGQGNGSISVSFVDPWENRGGFLDEVRISWNSSLEYVSALAFNDENPSIVFNRGNTLYKTIGWKNLDSATAPAEYNIILRYVG